MNEHRVRNAIILELLIPRPMGQDLTELRDELDQKLGGGKLPFREFRALLDQMADEGLLKKEERVVEGRRVALFYQATRNGLAVLRAVLTGKDNRTGLSIGRESHESRTETNTVHG